MIVLRVREMAEGAGVRNAHGLQLRAGLASHVAARLWKGDWERISAETLDKLCAAFDCQPGEFLTYEPAKRTKK